MEYIDKINAEIIRFNSNDSSVMTVKFDDNFAALFIDGQGIMTGFNIDVYYRVKQINKELGYNYL